MEGTESRWEMKHLPLTTIAAVLLVGCGESQQLPPAPEAAKPEPTTAKAPDISFWKAAYDGNIEAVKQHLAAGADVDEDKGQIGTPLYFAAFGKHKEIVELLITKGTVVNAKQIDGKTPLHSGSSGRDKEIVELFITKGADVNAKDGRRWTPLHYTAYYGHKVVAELLIAKGADVNLKGESGRTIRLSRRPRCSA